MANAPNHTFSKHDPDMYAEDKLFTVNRRDAALNVNTGHISGSNVVVVTDDPQWRQALELAGVQVLSQMGGNVALQARGAYIRSALRPASLGGGRDRFR